MSPKNSTTNVRAENLNYHRYAATKYDREIIRIIPGHRKIHQLILKVVRNNFVRQSDYKILDLGVGTGLTSALIQKALPKAHFEVVDFSRPMLRGTQKRLDAGRTKFIFGDYSKLVFKQNHYDLVISVIGLHHQTNSGKRKMIQRIFKALKPGGYFLLGDLMTYRNEKEAALNQARHFHHLVVNTRNNQELTDWAYHHIFLNKPAPVEDHVRWFQGAGFNPKILHKQFNTVLIAGLKPY